MVRLGEIAVRNTATFIADRVQAAKAKRSQSETIAELEEIISGLINDKNEVVQIAQAFEQEFVAQRISDSDLNYVTTNLIPVGEPLTTLLREFILAQAPRRTDEGAAVQLAEQQMLELMRLSQDPEALARFSAIAASDDADSEP